MKEFSLYEIFGLGMAAGWLSVAALAFFWRKQVEKRIVLAIRDRKNQFVGLSSHYLLSPIAIIQGALARLQEDDAILTAEKRLHLYDAIFNGQQRLWILAEQLILVGQIDDNELELHLKICDLSDLVGSSIAAVDSFARGKRLKIRFHDDTSDVREVRVDAPRLKQAFIALLDNAIKFSLEDGQVDVTLAYQEEVFTLSVQDRGIGMPDEVINHITEKFYRGTSLYNFDYEGIGLGLHIAHAIALAHHGGLSFESHQGKGTVARIQFPTL